MNKTVTGLENLGTLMATDISSSIDQRGEKSTGSEKASDTQQHGDSDIDNIKLTRKIPISCWRVSGQIATAQKRDELHFVLLRAQENGHTDAKDIANNHLGDDKSRTIVAKRLLSICVSLGLLEEQDKKYTLTPLGITAADNERVFIPEDGSWTVWASDDPLLDTPILHYEPWDDEPPPYEETRGKESKTKRNIKLLPDWLLAAQGHQSTPIATGGKSIRIEDFNSKGERIESSENTLRVIWNISKNSLHIDGRVAGKTVNADHLKAPAITKNKVWKQLLQSAHVWEQWNTRTSTMTVCFSDTTNTEREQFVRTQKIDNPSVDELGLFDSMNVRGIVLRETSIADASKWAQWRLKNQITSYATSEKFDTWIDEAIRPFKKYTPTTPSRENLANELWPVEQGRPTASIWHLVAADDWKL